MYRCQFGIMFFSRLLKVSLFTLLLVLFSGCDDDSSDQDAEVKVTQVIATGLDQPYITELVNTDMIVAVNGAVLKINKKGDTTHLTDITPGSPSGVLQAGSDFLSIDNTMGSLSLMTWDGQFIKTVATGLGDPVNLVRRGKEYFVTDYNKGLGNGRLLRVTDDGNVITLPVAAAELGGPSGIVVDDDTFVVTDFDGGRLLRVSDSGEVLVIATGLGNPVDVKVYGNGFLVVDFAGGTGEGGRLLYIDSTGLVSTLLDHDLGSPAGIEISGPNAIVSDIMGGQLLQVELSEVKVLKTQVITTGLDQPYITELVNTDMIVAVNGAVLKINKKGDTTHLTDITPGSPSGVLQAGSDFLSIDNTMGSLSLMTWDGQFIKTVATGLGDPVNLVRRGKEYFVTDYNKGLGNGRLLRVTDDGNVITLPVAAAELGGPSGIVVDDDTFVVTDFDGGRLLRVSDSGEVLVIATGLGNPVDVKVYGNGFLVVDFAGGTGEGGRLLYIDSTGLVSTLLDHDLGSPAGIEISGPNAIVSDIMGGRLIQVEFILNF